MSRPRPSLKTSTYDFGQLWGELSKDMLQVLHCPAFSAQGKGGDIPGVKWKQMYDNVYKLCTSSCVNVPYAEVRHSGKDGALAATTTGVLYAKVKELLEDYVNKEVLPEVVTKTQFSDEDLLQEYQRKWHYFSIGIDAVHRCFLFMNRDWIDKNHTSSGKVNSSDIHAIRTLGHIVWKEQLYLKIKEKMTHALLGQITNDRNGNRINTQLLRDILRSLVILGLDPKKQNAFYEDSFQTPFMEDTTTYYTKEVNEYLQHHTLAQYMEKMEQRLEEEGKRVTAYLDKSTEQPLLKALVKVMVESKQDLLLNECTNWFDNNNTTEQRRLFKLLSRSENGLEPLRKIVEDRIDADGKQEIEKIKAEAQKEPHVYVETLLKVYKKYEHMVKHVYDDDKNFRNALEKGCKKFINRNSLAPQQVGARSAELLARYSHLLLRPSKLNKQLTEAETDIKITEVLTIFALLEDKDVFQKFYSNLLSRRLIQGTYTRELETTMIAKLKDECGYDYTYKLSRMFQDMDVSNDLNQRFQQEVQAQGEHIGPDFSALVLTSGSWPLAPPKSSFALPSDIERGLVVFESHYKNKHNGRKLTWLHQLSSGILKTVFKLPEDKQYELQVTTYQMGILLYFNECSVVAQNNIVTLQAIQQHTRLAEKELIFALGILVKHRVLLTNIDMNSSNAPADGTFRLNEEYRSQHRRVVLHLSAPKDVNDEQTLKLVSSDRKYAIQAAIVRVMKARKTITHPSLITEVLSQLRSSFKPTVPDIKKSIDGLIERDYMERAEDCNTYNYLA